MNIPVKSYSTFSPIPFSTPCSKPYRMPYDSHESMVDELEYAFGDIHTWDYDPYGNILYIFDENLLNHEWIILQLLSENIKSLSRISFSMPYSVISIPFGAERRKMLFNPQFDFDGIASRIIQYKYTNELWISSRRILVDNDIQLLIKRKKLVKTDLARQYNTNYFFLNGEL